MHYDAYSSASDEFVTVDRVRKPGEAAAQPAVAAATPQQGKHDLDGLYLQVNLRYGMGGSMYTTYDYFWFRPDGNVFFGPPPGGLEAAADFAVLQKLDPKNCGTYGISGNQLSIQRAGEAAQTHELKTEANNTVLNFDGPAAIKVQSFKPGTKLEATYDAGGSAGGGTVFVTTASSLTFHADGTFEGGRVGGFSAAGEQVNLGGSSESSTRGTYTIAPNTITLTDSAGKRVAMTAFPFPEDAEFPPKHIGLGSEMYKLQK